jgi:hypothetical protein
MTSVELVPIEAVALEIARADMHYVSTALIGLPSAAAAAETALLQYGVMAAYEAKLHFKKTLAWDLPAEWDADTARAARMSGKFFADTKRNIEGVVAHFDELLQANYGAFYEPQRRGGRLLDFLRTDMSVILRDEIPYSSLISAHYLLGFGPAETGGEGTVGPSVLKLSTGFGNVARALLRDSDILSHEHAPIPEFAWFNTKSKVAFPRLFEGKLDTSLTAALLTVQGISMSAVHSESRVLCDWCESAARKHRFVALFQALTAIKILGEKATTRLPGQMAAFLRHPESMWILEQAKLRNGLVHLGLQDIASDLAAGSTIEDAVHAYTGQDPDEVARRVADHLFRFTDALTNWMLSPAPTGGKFHAALRSEPLR